MTARNTWSLQSFLWRPGSLLRTDSVPVSALVLFLHCSLRHVVDHTSNSGVLSIHTELKYKIRYVLELDSRDVNARKIILILL
jgi:hypothetical protein